MAFADTLVAHTDAEVVLVDRRHRPGGHWLDAYPFVRLHQPSAYYGVESRPLGHDRIDEHGPNAGFYERASAAEICDYYARVLDEHLLPTGRVRFFGMSDHRGGNGDGHLVVSLLDGSETARQAAAQDRRRDLRPVGDPVASRSRLHGRAGRHAHPAQRPRRPRRACRPLHGDRSGKDGDRHLRVAARGGSRPRPHPLDSRPRSVAVRPYLHAAARPGRRRYMRLQARWVEAAAAAEDGHDFARRLEDAGMFVRIDPSVEPLAFRGATVSQREIDALRTIEHVVRARRVRSIGRTSVDHRRRRRPRRPARGLRRLHGRRRSGRGPATGVRAGPHHDPVRGRRLPAVVRRHDRIRRVDRPRRRGEEPALPARRLLRRRGRSGADWPTPRCRARSLASRHEAVGPVERSDEAEPRPSCARPHRRRRRRRVAGVHDRTHARTRSRTSSASRRLAPTAAERGCDPILRRH